ncbi:methylmalonyl-CoA mutase [Burkholderia latens]|uniref:Methylmalonyl-CoA mutase n=1 Tax=Burkholderia latens TaxID=488446 RepID=A0A6H9T1Q9_9BURK|nr:methylmalonyl-CoA mutase [Burkholderia latens]KAB0644782.1 methylmalonyl-CoA mutase [Burkholderia latens]VWB17634.1 methylmalonyl-CoA mutase [Burkholderia latens]
MIDTRLCGGHPATLEKWIEQARKSCPEGDVSRLDRVSFDGIHLKALYTAHDIEGLPHLHGLPGLYPFVRGPQPTMYATRPWTIRQYAGFSTAAESNRFYRAALAGGAQGISVAFDLATHRGFDSDHPAVIGDVGKAGVAIDSVEDMKVLFDGIELDSVSVSMTMNGAVLPVLASFIVAAEEQGVDRRDLTGTIQNDILKEFIVRNTYIYPPGPSMRIVGDVLAYTAAEMPKFNSISISGYHMHEAGASTALELAFTIANGKEYVKTAIARGMNVDEFAGRLSFFFATGMDFYLEIAKLRAARLLWSTAMTELGAKSARSKALRMHCQTSGVSLTMQDPMNNVVRTTIEAMAAIFGGTQSLHTNSFDEAIGLPTDVSARLARNTQLILQEESDIPSVIDPWAGSFLIERLTHDVAQKARELMDEIERNGGMLKAVESGWAKAKIEAVAAHRQAMVDSKRSTIVGVNKYVQEKERALDHRDVDNMAVRREQLERLAGVRARRNGPAVAFALQKLAAAASDGTGNLLSLTVEAMRLRATVGEVSEVLAEVFGRYVAPNTATTDAYGKAMNGDRSWDDVRKKVERFIDRHGSRPRILISKLGQDGHDRGARVIAAGLIDLGFEVEIAPLFQTPLETARRAAQLQVDAVGVSSLAGGHKTLVLGLLAELKERCEERVRLFVGGIVPEDDRRLLLHSGVTGVYGPGTSIAHCAAEILQSIEQARAYKISKEGAEAL